MTGNAMIYWREGVLSFLICLRFSIIIRAVLMQENIIYGINGENRKNL